MRLTCDPLAFKITIVSLLPTNLRSVPKPGKHESTKSRAMKKLTSLLLAVGMLGGMAAAQAAGPRGTARDKLLCLPAGSITPGGWMARQMQEDANGWVRIADTMSRAGVWSLYSAPEQLQAPFYYPYIQRQGAPIAGEYQAHWVDAVTCLGYVGRDRACRKLADDCVHDLLAHQAADGYLGVEAVENQFRGTGKDSAGYEIWSYGETLNALLDYYRQSGDAAVLRACVKSADLACATFGPNGPKKQPVQKSQAWFASLATALSRLYRQTGDKNYLDTARSVEEQFLRGMWHPYGQILQEKKPLRGHAAGWGIAVLSLIELYRASGERQWLDDAVYAHDALAREHVQPHGAPSGMGEALAGTGPDLDTELCDTFWWIWCWTELLKATGEPRYADCAERAALNALPGQRSKDGAVTAYFMTPNQLAATQRLKNFYPARLYTECCQSNAPRALPLMAESAVLATSDGGLAVAFYGSSETRAKLPNGHDVIVRQQTDYPFSELIHLTLQLPGGPAAFPLLLRIPAWSRQAAITVNGSPVKPDHPAGTWARLERKWADGDRVTLTFAAEVQVQFWQRDGQRAAVLQRGPLLYALPVRGERKRLDQWGTFEERAAQDSAWNYALLLDAKAPAAAVRFKRLAVSGRQGHLWETAPEVLEVHARDVPRRAARPGAGGQAGQEPETISGHLAARVRRHPCAACPQVAQGAFGVGRPRGDHSTRSLWLYAAADDVSARGAEQGAVMSCWLQGRSGRKENARSTNGIASKFVNSTLTQLVSRWDR